MKKLLLTLVFISSIAFIAFADEGMWMLHLLKQQKLAEMQKLGLKLQDYDIYNPDGASLKDAVVQFGRGCTGEVISSQGLVLTNHHCGYGQIQSHSSLENNYLDDGFWAKSLTEELPNRGLTVTFIDRIEDVTDYVKRCLERDKDKDTDGVFFLSPSYLNGIAREKVGESFFAHKGMDVEIKPFFNGNQYYMFTKKIYSDVRLVGAPPSSIGKFGADTDNWMWPRHTGDFSLFRIYADKDGNPADYSPDNVPLKPKRWLKISTMGANENDFAMILGFPGSTHKYYTSWEVAERRDIDNRVRIDMRELRQDAMLEEMLKDPAVKIQYAAKYSGSTNAYKNAIGTNWAIDLRDFEQLKLEQQQKLVKWAQENRKPEYIEALNEIERIVEERSDLRYRSWMLNEGILRSVEFAQVPRIGWSKLVTLVNKMHEENTPADNEDLHGVVSQLEKDYALFANKDYNVDVDKKISATMISAYVDLVEKENQPSVFSHLHNEFEGNVTAFVNYIFDQSLFGNPDNWNRFKADPATYIADKENRALLLHDPLFLFGQSMEEEYSALQVQLSRFDIPFAKARRVWMEGILAMDGPYAHFPDANLTLRLTYGQVKGYSPRDAVTYSHRTTLTGVMEKEDPDNWEFVVPEKLKELYKEKDFGRYALVEGEGKMMPVCFAATTHTTGGNSGSPVLNAKGELIGLNFDRNWEGVGGDIQYLPDYQRSIIVDIRYVLFVIDKFAGAGHLIEELDID